MLRNYHITASMVIGNIMARSLVRLREEAPTDVMEKIYHEIEAEGIDTCGLEEDEIKAIYNKILLQSRRIFMNPRLHPAVTSLAGIIARRRSLTGGELRDQLNYLQL